MKKRVQLYIAIIFSLVQGMVKPKRFIFTLLCLLISVPVSPVLAKYVVMYEEKCEWVTDCKSVPKRREVCNTKQVCSEIPQSRRKCTPVVVTRNRRATASQDCRTVTEMKRTCRPERRCSTKTVWETDCSGTKRVCRNVSKRVWVPDPQPPQISPGPLPKGSTTTSPTLPPTHGPEIVKSSLELIAHWFGEKIIEKTLEKSGPVIVKLYTKSGIVSKIFAVGDIPIKVTKIYGIYKQAFRTGEWLGLIFKTLVHRSRINEYVKSVEGAYELYANSQNMRSDIMDNLRDGGLNMDQINNHNLYISANKIYLFRKRKYIRESAKLALEYQEVERDYEWAKKTQIIGSGWQSFAERLARQVWDSVEDQ